MSVMKVIKYAGGYRISIQLKIIQGGSRRNENPRIHPHTATKQRVLPLCRMGHPVRKNMKRKKTLSIISTILLTIYTILVVIYNIGIFAIASVFGQLSDSSKIKRLIVDDFDFGTIASCTSAIVTAMLIVTAFVLLILTIALVAATVLSYKFICAGKLRNDAWMKIVIFGVSFIGFVLTTSNIELITVFEAVLLVLPIVLSVVVLCDNCNDTGEEEKGIKEQ